MKTKRSRKPRGGLAIFGLIILSATLGGAPAPTSGAPVDAERQSSVFKRIFSYDKDLRNTDRIIVIVIGSSREDAEAKQVATVFHNKGLFPAVVATSELSDDLTATLRRGETVVYVTASADAAVVKAFAAAKGYLTISGQPAMAEAGHVSVSVDIAGERPEIVVNMARLRAEGHELSAELLNLARVIR